MIKRWKTFESNGEDKISDLLDILLEFFDDNSITQSLIEADSLEFWGYIANNYPNKYWSVNNKDNTIIVANLNNELKDSLEIFIKSENDRIKNITGLYANIEFISENDYHDSTIKLDTINPKSIYLYKELNFLSERESIAKVKSLDNDKLDELESYINNIKNLLNQ